MLLLRIFLLICWFTAFGPGFTGSPPEVNGQGAAIAQGVLPGTEEIVARLVAQHQAMLADIRSVEIRYAALGEPFETVRLRSETDPGSGEAVLVPEDAGELLAYFSFMQFLGDELRALLGPAAVRADTLNGTAVLRFTLDADALRGTPLLPDIQEAPLREAVFWLEPEQLQLAGFRFRSVNRFGRTVELMAQYPRYETQQGFAAPAEILLSMTGVYAQISDEEYAAELAELTDLLNNIGRFPEERRAQAERELRELKAELHRMARGQPLAAELRLTGLIVRPR